MGARPHKEALRRLRPPQHPAVHVQEEDLPAALYRVTARLGIFYILVL